MEHVWVGHLLVVHIHPSYPLSRGTTHIQLWSPFLWWRFEKNALKINIQRVIWVTVFIQTDISVKLPLPGQMSNSASWNLCFNGTEECRCRGIKFSTQHYSSDSFIQLHSRIWSLLHAALLFISFQTNKSVALCRFRFRCSHPNVWLQTNIGLNNISKRCRWWGRFRPKYDVWLAL